MRTHFLLLTIFSQTVILGFAWGFTGAILFRGVIALPDHIVSLIVEYPTVLTLVVTLISTALSMITTACGSIYMYNLKSHTPVSAQILHICCQRSSSSPPLRADYIVQASHCDSAE